MLLLALQSRTPTRIKTLWRSKLYDHRHRGRRKCHSTTDTLSRLPGVGLGEANVAWVAGASTDNKSCSIHKELPL